MSYSCWEFMSPSGTNGKIMAHNKAHAILTIKELFPSVNLLSLTILREDMWTSNQR
jgi:hypothetical protein